MVTNVVFACVHNSLLVLEVSIWCSGCKLGKFGDVGFFFASDDSRLLSLLAGTVTNIIITRPILKCSTELKIG